MLSHDFLKFKLMRPGAILPKRATDGSGAFDFYAPEPGALFAGQKLLIPSGVAHDMPGQLFIQAAVGYTDNTIQIPIKMQGILFDRSGLGGKKGIRLSFSCLIDNDYRGEILLSFENTTNEFFKWDQGDRLCQIAYIPMFSGQAVETKDLSFTGRGEGGFGSTGK